MKQKLHGEALEYVAMHLVGTYCASRVLEVTVDDAPNATVMAGILEEIYNPLSVKDADGSSATFSMVFGNMYQASSAGLDIDGAVDAYRQTYGHGSSSAPEPEDDPEPEDEPEPTPGVQASQATVSSGYTYLVLGIAALIIILILLWQLRR